MSLQLALGCKAYTDSLSVHIDGEEFIYRAPYGKKFAVILMAEEFPNNDSGIDPYEFLVSRGCNKEITIKNKFRKLVQTEIKNFFWQMRQLDNSNFDFGNQIQLMSKVSEIFIQN